MLSTACRPVAFASASSWLRPLAHNLCAMQASERGVFHAFRRIVQSSAYCWPWVTRTLGLFGEPPSERIITFISLRAGGSPKGSRPFGYLRGWHGDSHQPDQSGKEGNPSNGLGGGFHPRPPVPSPATGETFAVNAWSRYGEEVCECHGFVLRGSRIS